MISARTTALVSILTFALAGCSTTEQVQTYIRDAHVAGPVASPPVHVVTDHAKNAVTFSFYAVQQGKDNLAGNIEGSGTNGWLYSPELVQRPDGSTSYARVIPRYNMDWKRPEFSGGADLDIAWEGMALTVGGAFSRASGASRLGWQAGLGFFTREQKPVRVRLDLGVFAQYLEYQARTATITTVKTEWFFSGSTTSVDTSYYFDRDTKGGIGYYGTLTINTAVPSWPLDLFLQFNYINQPVLSYTPVSRTTTDFLLFLPVQSTSGSGDIATRASFIGLTPGIYIEPTPDIILTGGVRALLDISDTFKEPNVIVMPFVQLGFRVGM
jgi:hypothetical protein